MRAVHDILASKTRALWTAARSLQGEILLFSAAAVKSFKLLIDQMFAADFYLPEQSLVQGIVKAEILADR